MATKCTVIDAGIVSHLTRSVLWRAAPCSRKGRHLLSRHSLSGGQVDLRVVEGEGKVFSLSLKTSQVALTRPVRWRRSRSSPVPAIVYVYYPLSYLPSSQSGRSKTIGYRVEVVIVAMVTGRENGAILNTRIVFIVRPAALLLLTKDTTRDGTC